MIRVRVVVTGRVQGVWFRQSCRDVAIAAGVCGWVRNRVDGRVEAVLEGERGSVQTVVDWMRIGPRHAVVRDVHVTAEQPQGARTFVVR